MKTFLRLYIVAASCFLLSCGSSNSVENTAGQGSQNIPSFSLRTARPMITEGETASLELHMNRAAGANTEMIWEVLTESRRFNATSGSFTVPAGATVQGVEIATIANSVFDGDSAVRVRVRDAQGSMAPVEISLAVGDDDPMPILSVGDREGVRGTSIELAIELSSASNLETHVSWQTVDASAVAGADYEAAAGTVTIPAGETRALIRVRSLPLARESSFAVRLIAVQNAAVVDDAATVRIRAGNALDTKVSFTAPSSLTYEGAGTANIGLQLSTPVGVDVRVEFTIEGDAAVGSDFAAVVSSITIPAGASTAILPVTILEDSTFERQETLRLRMTSSSNAGFGLQTSHSLYIADNDAAPSISVGDAQAAEGGNLTFTIYLGQVSGADTTFFYMTTQGTAGLADFMTSAGTVTIPAGQALARVSVPTLSDTIHEVTENFTFTITEANGASILRGTARGSILDDDTAPVVQFASASQTLRTTQTDVVVNISLSAVSGADVNIPFTVGGNTIEGVDHNLGAGVISIPAGSASATLTFSVFRHGPPTKNIVITMTSASGASLGSTAQHTVSF